VVSEKIEYAAPMLDPVATESVEKDVKPRWALAKRILFRFAFAYLVLYNLPVFLEYIPYVGQAHQSFWDFLVPAVADQLFGVVADGTPNGSGDTTFNYVQVFCFLVLSLAATLIWSFLDRRRAEYARLDDWLRVYVRFALAAVMISYGAIKVMKGQFPDPSLDRLLQPYGQSSPMGLLWTFMGASAPYTIFSGFAELIPGLLLTVRRTALLGALLSCAVMTNVVLLNFCYDVPVKLFSNHLLLMGIFLVLPHARRLTDLFVFNRGVEPAADRPLFRKKGLNQGALALRTVVVLTYTGFALYFSFQQNKLYGSSAPKPPLYGIWNVEELTIDGVARPPLVTDESRWRRIVFTYPGQLSILHMSDARTRYALKLDQKKGKMELRKRDDPKWVTTLSYQRTAPDALAIQGTVDGQNLQARLKRTDASDFLLVNRGFRWINEFPFNR
jgi:hypothetical protein